MGFTPEGPPGDGSITRFVSRAVTARYVPNAGLQMWLMLG
jgi:hypothetical protein